MQESSNLSVLIIDPNPGMRASLHGILGEDSISKIDYANSASIAVRQLSAKQYDIILCEYDLGDGQDGQQLLEDLRRTKLTSAATIFIMLTSEGQFSKVLSAAELTPTDYILKPFTLEALTNRIGRAIERRARFLPIYQLIEQGRLREAIEAAGAAEHVSRRYAADFARLRAELHLRLEEAAAAERIYLGILAARPLDWAHFGLARALCAQQRYPEAQERLGELLGRNSHFMAGYDLLAQTHTALGQAEQAQKVLEDAVALSPHVVQRLRRLGQAALEAGDNGTAERAFKQVVVKARHSEFRDPEDHLNLVRALVKGGNAAQAESAMRELERATRASANGEICRALGQGLLLQLSGKQRAAAEEFATAAGALEASKGMSAQFKLGLLHNCIENELDKEASDVMLNLVNDADHPLTMDQAVGMFNRAGRPDLGQGMGVQIGQQVQDLMSDALDKGRQGEHRAAVMLLAQALRKAPGNLALLLASAQAILNQLDELGWEAALAEQAQRQMHTIGTLDPRQPALAALRQRYAAVQAKYGIAA